MEAIYGTNHICALKKLCQIHYGVINLSGEHGTGKTFLLNHYKQYLEKEGYIVINMPDEFILANTTENKPYTSYESLLYWLEDVKYIKNRISTYALIIDPIFTLKFLSKRKINLLYNFYKKSPNVLIIITSLLPQNIFHDVINIQLFNFTNQDTYNYIHNTLPYIPTNIINIIFNKTNGNILLVREFCKLIQNINTIPDTIIYHNCIVGTDGQPISSHEKTNIKINVSEIDNQLLYEISKNPKLLYNISSYDFERVIAKIFEKRGFSVKITAQTRDGGKDIFVAKNDLCSFLFYIECKKYAPNRPVGIEVIQRLYGVISAEKATGGIIATTSTFTKPAKDYIQEHQLEHQITLQDYNAIVDIINNLKF